MFSLIILSMNNPEVTRRCLDSAVANSPEDTELVVVDNGSDEATLRMLHTFAGREDVRGRVQLIENEENLGCSTARNQATAAARGDVLVTLDNDVEIEDPRWLHKLWAVLEEDESIGMVGPKLVYPGRPRRIQFAGGGVSPTGKIQFRGRGEPAEAPAYNTRREVQFFITACMMYRRRLVDDIGPYDEVYNPVQFEDIDLCYRAREAGYRVLYEPTVEVVHHESVTTNASGQVKNAYVVVKNGLTFKRRWKHMFENEDGPRDQEISSWTGVEGSKGFPAQKKESK